MKRLAAWIAGSAALLVMLLSEPWSRLSCPPDSCSMTTSYEGLWMVPLWVLAELVVPIGILTAILVGVLGVRDANAPRDLAVLAALGQTRRAAVRGAAATGARHAAVAVGGGYVLAGIVHLAVLQVSSWPLWTTDRELWLVRLSTAVLVSIALVLAHIIDATRPHRTPVERLYEDAADRRPPRVSLRLRASIIGGLGAAAAGLIVGLAIAHNQANGSAYFVAGNTAGISLGVVVVACGVMLLAVVIPWAQSTAPLVLRASGGAARRVGAHGLATVLETRAGNASAVAARIVSVLGGLAFLVGFAASGPTSPNLSDRYVGTATFTTTGDPADVVRQYRAIDGVGAVVLGTYHQSADYQYGGDAGPILIQPDDLKGIDESLRDLLVRHPTAVIGGYGSSTAFVGADGFVPTGIVPLGTYWASFANGSTVNFDTDAYGLLIYAADGRDVQELARHLNNTGPAAPGITSSGGSYPYGSPSTSVLGSIMAIAAILVLVVAPIAGLSVGVARRRRRDDATLAALGAQPRTLRWAVVVEATAVAAFAGAVGLGWGALTHAIVTVLNRARQSLSGVITDSYAQVAVSSVPWVALLLIGVAAVAVFGISAAIAARALQRRTPVDNLRPTDAGVLS